MKERYIRNIPAISEEQQLALTDKHVFIVGCGGLGGYIVEELARLGVGYITLADGDVFNESNLNRQLYSSTDKIGVSKIEATAERICKVNPDIELVGIDEFLPAEQVLNTARGNDLVIDALDNIDDRLTLEDICEKLNIPLVHGAVRGWNLQVAVSAPGSGLLHKIYKSKSSKSDDPADKTCLCPTPAICASIQVAEALKILIGEQPSLEGKMFFMDLKSMESYTIEI